MATSVKTRLALRLEYSFAVRKRGEPHHSVDNLRGHGGCAKNVARLIPGFVVIKMVFVESSRLSSYQIASNQSLEPYRLPSASLSRTYASSLDRFRKLRARISPCYFAHSPPSINHFSRPHTPLQSRGVPPLSVPRQYSLPTTLTFAASTSPSALVRYALMPSRIGVYLASDSSQCLDMGLPYTHLRCTVREGSLSTLSHLGRTVALQ